MTIFEGGVKRYELENIGPESGLGVHSVGLPDSRRNTQLSSAEAACYMQVAEIAAVRIIFHAIEMGIDIKLVALEANVDQENIHVLTREEMREYRVITHDTHGQAVAGVAVASALPATP